MKYEKTQDILNRDTLTYSEILKLKKRFTGYTNNKDISLDEAEMKEEYNITPEHTEKGLEYLFRVAFKPSMLNKQKEVFQEKGLLDEAIRKNSPLGYRELTILLQFDHFTFTGFYDATNMYQRGAGYRSLYPIWKCYDKDGDSFEYYLEGGQMQVIG